MFSDRERDNSLPKEIDPCPGSQKSDDQDFSQLNAPSEKKVSEVSQDTYNFPDSQNSKIESPSSEFTFRTYPIEKYGKGLIYRALGVKYYARLVNQEPKCLKASNAELLAKDLRDIVSWTKENEKIHLRQAAIAGVLTFAVSMEAVNAFSVIFGGITVLLAYPILYMRYIRVKLDRILDVINQRALKDQKESPS